MQRTPSRQSQSPALNRAQKVKNITLLVVSLSWLKDFRPLLLSYAKHPGLDDDAGIRYRQCSGVLIAIGIIQYLCTVGIKYLECRQLRYWMLSAIP